MIHPEHKNFARAVVALAREHGMDRISMQFSFGFDKAYPDGAPSRGNDTVKMGWSTGRHGDTSNINLESQSFEAITESPASLTPTGEAAP